MLSGKAHRATSSTAHAACLVAGDSAPRRPGGALIVSSFLGTTPTHGFLRDLPGVNLMRKVALPATFWDQSCRPGLGCPPIPSRRRRNAAIASVFSASVFSFRAGKNIRDARHTRRERARRQPRSPTTHGSPRGFLALELEPGRRVKVSSALTRRRREPRLDGPAAQRRARTETT